MRKRRFVCAALGILVVTVWLVHHQWPAYLKFKEKRAIYRAVRCFGARDWAGAALNARQVLQTNPRQVRACRVLADLAEMAGSPAALDWRRRVSDLEPDVTNALALASTALRFENPPFRIAQASLEKVAETNRSTTQFQALAALVDLKLDRLGEAREHFRTAVSLDPSNAVYRLNLAVTELQSSDQTTSLKARATLEDLSAGSAVKPLALRSLVADSLRRRENLEAARFSQRLLASPVFQLEDQLMDLTVLDQIRHQEGAKTGPVQEVQPGSNGPEELIHMAGSNFEHRLSIIQEQVARNPMGIHQLCAWMGSHQLAKRSLKWLETLDPKIRRLQPVPPAQADLYAAAEEWEALEQFLHAQESWGEIEFLRQALQARTAWGLRRDAVGAGRWRNALRSAGDRLSALVILLRLSEEWGRDSDEVLWAIWPRFPSEQWAGSMLERRYIALGDTRGLNRIYSRRLEDPNTAQDVTNRNDFACTALLLGVQLPRAHQVARELHLQNPDDLIIASTYAYSLQLQGRPEEGLQLFAGFDAAKLEQPAVALYYGALLASVGQTQAARHYLNCAKKVRLSPEEVALLRQSERLTE